MPARRQPPVHAQIHRHRKTASSPGTSLIRLDLLPRSQIPYVNPPITRCARKIPLISAQRNGPNISSIYRSVRPCVILLSLCLARRGHNLPHQRPFPSLPTPPYFYLPAEPDARGDGARAASSAARRAYVVAAELVCVRDGLRQREARVDGAVDAQGRGAAC